jgi:hypothetical protein
MVGLYQIGTGKHIDQKSKTLSFEVNPGVAGCGYPRGVRKTFDTDNSRDTFIAPS